MAAGCSQVEELSLSDIQNMPGIPSLTQKRSTDEAIDIAQIAADKFFPSCTKNSIIRNVDSENLGYCISESANSLSKDTVIYVINFKDEKGFVLVGADKDSPELIAIVENGNFDGGKTDNQGFNMYIEEVMCRLSNIPDYGSNEEITAWEYKYETDERSGINEPLVHVAWHQDPPFNKYCPDPTFATGCVATAIAMTISAYKYPAEVELTFPEAPVNSVVLDWDEMIAQTHNRYHDGACSYCDQNALLQREIGQRVGMNYGLMSSAYMKDIPECLESFGFHSPVPQKYKLTSVLSSLSSGSVVIIGGTNEAGNGHAWVVDGSKYEYVRTDAYRRDVHKGTSWEHCNYNVTESWYLHMNYGGGSSYIGYYLSQRHVKAEGVLTVGLEIDSYDVTMFTGLNSYNKNVEIIPNIYID